MDGDSVPTLPGDVSTDCSWPICDRRCSTQSVRSPQVKADGRAALQRGVASFMISASQPAGFAANRPNELRLPMRNQRLHPTVRAWRHGHRDRSHFL